MRRTRHTILTALILLAGCATDDNRLGGQEPLEPSPDSGAGSGGAPGASGGGAAGSGGGSGAAGSGGISGTGEDTFIDVYTAFVSQVVTTGENGPTGRCMPRPLELDVNGGVPCIIAEGVPSECDCTRPGYRPPSAAVAAAARAQMQKTAQCGPGTARSCESMCVCELEQLVGHAAEECRNSPTNTSDGWCYIDPAYGIGSAERVNACPSSHKRLIRFTQAPTVPAIKVLMCTDRRLSGVLGPERDGMIGDACIHWNETVPAFSGFSNEEVSIEIGTPQCSSGVCLANHFQGRVTCPYGQYIDQSQPDLIQAECFVPGSGAPVTIDVMPQDSQRRSMESVYCSCRCAGPGPGPFCSCPQGYSCIPLADDIGLPASSGIAGSYCVREGTEYRGFPEGIQCDRSVMNCE